MPTLSSLASTLRKRIAHLRLTQEALSTEAGISRQTLSKVLSGRADLKVTTLLALADRLGLEVMLVPKEVSPGMAAEAEPHSRVRSVVDAALDTLPLPPTGKQNRL